MFLLAHMGFAAVPGALVSKWWGESRGFADGAPDLRWLLAGTVLPDLVDKTLGQILFRSYFQNGRIFCHTAAFTLAVFVAGAYRLRYGGDNRIMLMACGVASHFVLDSMWLEPVTTLWPALGPFVRDPSTQGFFAQVMENLGEPFFWATELGGALMLTLSLRLLGIEDLAELKGFIRQGRSPSLVPFEAGR